MISSLGVTTIVLSWILTPISIVAVGLHILHHLHGPRSLGLDDWLLIGALLVTLIHVIMITWAIADEGSDQHLEVVSLSKLARVSHVGILALHILMAL